jgi:hypothetical protein
VEVGGDQEEGGDGGGGDEGGEECELGHGESSFDRFGEQRDAGGGAGGNGGGVGFGLVDEERDQGRGCEGGDTAANEAGAEFVEGADDPFAGSVFGEVHSGGDSGEGLVFEVTAGEDFAVEGREFEKGGVEVVEGDRVGVVHGGGLREGRRTVFVIGAATLGTGVGLDGVDGDGEEPCGEARVGRCAAGGAFAGKQEEDGLGDFGGGVGVAGLTQSGGVDQLEVAGVDAGRGGKGGHEAASANIMSGEREIGHKNLGFG